MIAWQLPCLSHILLANGAVLMLTLLKPNERVVCIYVLEEAPELDELLDFFVEVLHQSVAVLNQIERDHREIAGCQASSNLEEHRAKNYLDATVEYVESKVQIEFCDHL